jgi:hypothetical protein
MKANNVCYHPLDQQYFEEHSIELKIVNCVCNCHVQCAVCCWHGNYPNGVIFLNAMCNIRMPIDIASKGTSVRGYQNMRASSTSPT